MADQNMKAICDRLKNTSRTYLGSNTHAEVGRLKMLKDNVKNRSSIQTIQNLPELDV